ncbi:MAG: hypothetical protein ACOYYU_16630 [Chloroflexota bacterium]
MNFTSIFKGYRNWSEGAWIIHTALRVWSSHAVDSGSGFYQRIMKRSTDHENTFSPENINSIREYLSAASKAARKQTTRIPRYKVATRIERPYHVDEQRDGINIAEYMLQLDQESALTFLENLSIYWAANLPVPGNINDSSLEHGRYLYLLAEQME